MTTFSLVETMSVRSRDLLFITMSRKELDCIEGIQNINDRRLTVIPQQSCSASVEKVPALRRRIKWQCARCVMIPTGEISMPIMPSSSMRPRARQTDKASGIADHRGQRS
ncbi:hypothetical protein [Sinorhizobium psoraleae]|uniref:hypothetical protein n=1 Tax=Sinorhizobium psoraleae TaxID=520838 RepID=UPI00156863FE|nr:hypothetical protein [Sinorhizobium psoraleae]